VEGPTRAEQQYVLGNDPDELTRLDRQSAMIERPSRLLLQAAGIAPGMRVLDLGTGLGHVARMAGELVGPTGSVLGIDRSTEALAVARERAQGTGTKHVTFAEGSVDAWRTSEPFDAVIGRLLLFHVTDPVAVVRHHLHNLRPGGVFVAIDFDIGAARAEPPVPVISETGRRIEAAFRAAGAWPRIGARLGTILEGAGLSGVATFGIQAYLPPRDPSGPALFAGVTRSLAPAIIRHDIATAEQLDIASLERRIAEGVRNADAVILPPTVVGAWGYSPEG
jgi:ubiquinone/menaquinone biosynthesis C-methylase UbiE